MHTGVSDCGGQLLRGFWKNADGAAIFGDSRSLFITKLGQHRDWNSRAIPAPYNFSTGCREAAAHPVMKASWFSSRAQLCFPTHALFSFSSGSPHFSLEKEVTFSPLTLKGCTLRSFSLTPLFQGKECVHWSNRNHPPHTGEARQCLNKPRSFVFSPPVEDSLRELFNCLRQREKNWHSLSQKTEQKHTSAESVPSYAHTLSRST